MVAFAVLLASILRDVALSENACAVDPPKGLVGIVLEIRSKPA